MLGVCLSFGETSALLSMGPAVLLRALPVLDIFWFGQDLHLLPSITPVPESPLQPSCSSLPKENKEWSGLKRVKIGDEFSSCAYLSPLFGIVRVRVKGRYSKGVQRWLLKRQ